MASVSKPSALSGHWRCSTDFGLGLDDGVSGGLAAYGNAVVPQVVEVIGRAIMARDPYAVEYCKHCGKPRMLDGPCSKPECPQR